MIILNNVSKKFEQTEAVKNISLKIKPGEIVGLLGPNGAGKTTTIRMLTGVLPPTKGKVEINGKNFFDNSTQLKSMIGYLPENNPLYEDLTVEEHLYFWLGMKGIVDGKRQKEAINFSVESTGIGSVYYRFIGELSKGYRQRVGLAQAILAKPEILILDEPTEGLDPNQRRDIQKLLVELQKSRTVIVSSHVLGEISKLASRIIIIHNGRVVGDDTPTNLVKAQSGEQEIEVEILGKGVSKGLATLSHVKSVNSKGKNTYLIVVDTDKDLRQDIFDLAVGKKWKLLEIKVKTRELEDVFTELTTEQI
jgi:ABC-2 type transport system ATP-binding protein